MTFRGVYLIWGLLPLWFLTLTFWVYLRPLFKVSGKEKLSHYFPSLVYTGGCFILTLVLDHLGIVEAAVNFLVELGIMPPGMQLEIIRFLLFPMVLAGVANIQKILQKEDSDKKRTLPKSQWR